MHFRFILIISFSTLLTLTTTPLSLSDAVEALLKPLTIFKVPAHEIGLMLSLSLRFVPTLMDDTTRIMNAQKARGVDFGEGNIIQKVRSIIPILIPLFASSFKRADALAIAMEARGYLILCFPAPAPELPESGPQSTKDFLTKTALRVRR